VCKNIVAYKYVVPFVLKYVDVCVCVCVYALSAVTLLVGRQDLEHSACTKLSDEVLV